jgi:Serine/threonine protein phosphatase
MQWQAVGWKEKGIGHIKNGTPCQDDFNYQIISNEQVIIGAVSDGMGSAAHSELGSQIAVQTAIRLLNQNNLLNTPINEDEARAFFEKLLNSVVTEIQAEAKNQGYAVRDLACTLLAFVATPDWLAAMQVGDGLIVIRPKEEATYELLFRPTKGEYGNETVPITSSTASQEMQVTVIPKAVDFICAATDGIEHISLLKSKTWIAYEKFFEPLERQIMRPNITQTEKQNILRDFLNSEQVNQKTDDDKTVLLCIQQEENRSDSVKTQSSNISKPVQKSDLSTSPSPHHQSSDDFPESPNDIKQALAQVKKEIYNLISPQDSNLDIKLKIEKRTLKIGLISKSPLDKEKSLNSLESVNINIKLFDVEKVLIFNQIFSIPKACWSEEVSLVLLPFWIKKLLKIAVSAVVMTLIFVLITNIKNQALAIFIYFIYSFILIFIFSKLINKK